MATRNDKGFDYNAVDWPKFFLRIKNGPRGTLSEIAREIGMSHQRLSKIYHKWELNQTYDPRDNTWGGNNRAFSHTEEATILQTLISEIGSKGFAVPGDRIREVFLALWSQKHARQTRKHHFAASNGFLYGLAHRHLLSGRRGQKSRKKDPDEKEIEAYKTEVRDALQEFPAKRVFNSDETPIRVRPSVVYTTQFRGQPTPALRTNGNPKDNVTAIATVSADGTTWPLTIVAKGTTQRCVRNLALPDDVFTEYSPSGKTNWEICKRHVNRISQFANGEPCALIWDGYLSHWTDPVTKEAETLNVRLIAVPDNATARCQPLDATVFGAVTSKHEALLRQLDVFEKKPLAAKHDAVHLYNRAWKGVKKSVIKRGFREAVQ